MSEPEPTIHRILVALDASPHSLAALEAAVELASVQGAELIGVYVEDDNLVRLGQLPITRVVTPYPVRVRRIEAVQIERHFHTRARRARKALVDAAAHAGVRASFRVERGEINAVLLHAAEETDLIFVGRLGWSRRHGLGSTARAVLAGAPALVMLFHHGARMGLPLLIVYGDTPASRQALAMAGPLARGGSGFLTVLILAADEDQARTRQAEAAERLGEIGLRARFRWLLHGDLPHLADLIHSEMGCALVLPADLPLLQDGGAGALLEGLACPALVLH